MTEPTTPAIKPEKIAELRALLAKATPGPYEQVDEPDAATVRAQGLYGPTILVGDASDIAWSVAVREHMPALLDLASSALSAQAERGWREKRDLFGEQVDPLEWAFEVGRSFERIARNEAVRDSRDVARAMGGIEEFFGIAVDTSKINGWTTKDVGLVEARKAVVDAILPPTPAKGGK